MLGSSKRYLAVALFTALLILLINVVWWTYYGRTEKLLERSLSRRLVTIAQSVSLAIDSRTLDELLIGSGPASARVDGLLTRLREADSVGELFVLNDNLHVVATSNLEPDSVYLLAELNGVYIDSVLFRQSTRAIATPSYKSGDLYLKSAYSPLLDSTGSVAAVLGVEASVDYFDSLSALKRDLYYATALSIAGGIILGLVFLLLQRGLNRAEQQLFLGETQRHLGRMVAVVAHEVRNPLMIIRASAERLATKFKAEEAGYIVEETDRLSSIVSGYLEFARAEGSLLSGEQPEEFDLVELVQSVKKHFLQRYSSEQVDWIESPEPTSLMLSGYRRSLRQVLLNLMINGAEACQAVSKPIAVGVKFRELDVTVELAVVDRGPGISNKELKKLFTPFYTTKQTGSGLGLYLTRRLITEMGGTLEVLSELDKGTQLVIRLPKRTGK